jgi:hypothetical protein
MRVKTAYEVTTDDRGKKVPVKIGLTPEQRAGIEYEFDIVGDMDLDNTLTISKTRCPALSQAVIRRPGPEVAETILEWLGEGAAVLDANEYRDLVLQEADPGELRELYRQVRDRGLHGAAVQDGTGETTTLRELIVQRGKDIAPVRPVDELPRNSRGAISRAATTDAEKAAAGLMTDEVQQEHTALGGGHPGEHKTPKPDRPKVSRIRPFDAPNGAPAPPTGSSAASDPWDGVPPENRPGTIGPKLGKVQALFSRWFTEDERDDRIKAAERMVRRPLTGPQEGRSFSNLTLAEANMLLKDWADVKDPGDLIARLAETVTS